MASKLKIVHLIGHFRTNNFTFFGMEVGLVMPNASSNIAASSSQLTVIIVAQ
jgi:hypothetical protein